MPYYSYIYNPLVLINISFKNKIKCHKHEQAKIVYLLILQAKIVKNMINKFNVGYNM
jgi:hypothetical protein